MMGDDTEKIVLKKEDKKDNSLNSSSVKYKFNTKVTKKMETSISSSNSLVTRRIKKYSDNVSIESLNKRSEGDERSQEKSIANDNSFTESSKFTANAEANASKGATANIGGAEVGQEVSGTVSAGYEYGTEYNENFSSEDKSAAVMKINKLVQ